MKTRGQWPYRLASYGDKLIISDSKLGLKFEIRGINHAHIFMCMKSMLPLIAILAASEAIATSKQPQCSLLTSNLNSGAQIRL